MENQICTSMTCSLYDMLRKFNIVLIFLLFSGVSIDGYVTDSTSGLLFRSNKELIDQRTSLDLYNGHFQQMTDSFSIRFDISILDSKTFGYIFRLVNKKKEEISFVFITFRNNDSLYFDFNSNITNNSIHIPISKEYLKKGSWLPVLIQFDLLKDSATITVQEESYTCNYLGLNNSDYFKFIFGLYGINLDVAYMALKNISITKHNNKTELFPLNESQGNTIYNSQGIAKGYVKNPVWLINKHYEWEKITEFSVTSVPGITYNHNTNQIMVINHDSITLFDMGTRNPVSISSIVIPSKTVSGEAIYSKTKNCCYIYKFDDTISKIPYFTSIDFNSNPPSVKSGYATINNRLHHHNVFLSEGNEKELYVFGGYGKYTYSNIFHKFNQGYDRWDTIAFSGDMIYPRFFAASGKGPNPDEILLYGGFGNQSGRQELGGRNLYDLFQINLADKTIKKLWEQKITDELFVPCGNLFLDQGKKYFYTLCYPHHIAKTYLKLYKFNIDDGSYEIVSNALPVTSEKIESKVFLFFDESLQEFITVIREYVSPEKSIIRIYSLYSPPVSLAKLENFQPKEKTSWILLTILISLLLAMDFAGIIYFIWKNKIKESKMIKDFSPDVICLEETMQIQEDKQHIKKCNALYVLGDFMAFDKNGKDITYRFSAKLQSLVAIVLLSQKDGNSITTKKLTSDLWPDKKNVVAKNIRGVTINHLRNILEDIDGIQLVYDNSKWYFSFDADFYCDYLHTLNIMTEIPKSKYSKNLIQQLAILIKRGSLFRNIETEWIDDFKQEYETAIDQLLKLQLQEECNGKNDKNVINLSDALFVIDPLNEEVLLITIRFLKKTGKIEYSQNLYNRFSHRYETIMGVTYPVKYSFI